MDFTQCPCSGKSLARLVQPAVMAILAQEPTHGYRIVQRLGQLSIFHGQRPDPTGVYRMLKAMEDDGSVVAAWDLAEAGPAKRRYELTRRGRACLDRWVQTLNEYQQAIEGLLELATTSSKQVGSRATKTARPSPCPLPEYRESVSKQLPRHRRGH